MKKIFRIGTRGSLLALTQAGDIQKRLEKVFFGRRFKLVIIKTKGDEFQGVELFKKNNIGVFTKSIEKKLLEGAIDIAVHSLKDLPTDLAGGLKISAIPKRIDPRDVILSRKRWSLATIPRGATVGTGSPRRKRQLSRLRPDLQLLDIRGNLDTRVKRVLKEKRYDAIVVAKAGLFRIKKYLNFTRVIPSDQLLPAVGQAAIGIQIRSNDGEMYKMTQRLNHARTEKEALAEREFLKCLGGGCRVPVGIHSKIVKNSIFLRAAVFSPHSNELVQGEIRMPLVDYKKAGAKLAKRFLKKGAAKFLKEARNG